MKKQFLLQYHLSPRTDEGWKRMALVTADNLEQAKKILIKAKTYLNAGAMSSREVKPDHIECLNLEEEPAPPEAKHTPDCICGKCGNSHPSL